jgi:metal-sulfur cluster biosynthetic enzyme
MDDDTLNDFERQRVLAALREVDDPEIGENIVDLGLVGRIDVLPWQVNVSLVPTSATCPMTDLLVEHATDAVQRLYPGTEICVEIDWDAHWTPQRMSAPLREAFGW